MSVCINSCRMGEMLENWTKRETIFQKEMTHFLKIDPIYVLPRDSEWLVSQFGDTWHTPCWIVTLMALWRLKCFLRVTGPVGLKFLQMCRRGLCVASLLEQGRAGSAWRESLLFIWVSVLLCRLWHSFCLSFRSTLTSFLGSFFLLAQVCTNVLI